MECQNLLWTPYLCKIFRQGEWMIKTHHTLCLTRGRYINQYSCTSIATRTNNQQVRMFHHLPSYSSTHPLPLHMALQYFHFLNVMFTFSSCSALSFHSLHSAIQLLCRTEPSQCWGTFVLVQPLIASDTALQSAACHVSDILFPATSIYKWYRIWWNAWPNLQQSVSMAALSSSSQHCLLFLQKDTVTILAIFHIVKSVKRTRGEHKHCDRYVMTPFEFQSLGGICVTCTILPTLHTLTDTTPVSIIPSMLHTLTDTMPVSIILPTLHTLTDTMPVSIILPMLYTLLHLKGETWEPYNKATLL